MIRSGYGRRLRSEFTVGGYGRSITVGVTVGFTVGEYGRSHYGRITVGVTVGVTVGLRSAYGRTYGRSTVGSIRSGIRSVRSESYMLRSEFTVEFTVGVITVDYGRRRSETVGDGLRSVYGRSLRSVRSSTIGTVGVIHVKYARTY